jgi:hypothetical protein
MRYREEEYFHNVIYLNEVENLKELENLVLNFMHDVYEDKHLLVKIPKEVYNKINNEFLEKKWYSGNIPENIKVDTYSFAGLTVTFKQYDSN